MIKIENKLKFIPIIVDNDVKVKVQGTRQCFYNIL